MNNEAYGFTGCTFWLDAAYGTNTQTDLAAVSYWKTKVGSSNYIQDTAANQPRLIVSDALYNNNPTIQFHDTARRMNETLNPLRLSATSTLVMICNYDTINTTVNSILGPTSGNINFFYLGGQAASYTGVGGQFNSLFFQNTTETTSPQIIVFTKNEIYINGSLSISSLTIPFETQFVQLGCQSSSGASALIGRIAEILLFNYKFDATQVSSISGRLNSKYAIY